MGSHNEVFGRSVLVAVLLARLARAAEPVAVSAGITNVIADVGLFVSDKRGHFAAENLRVSFVPFYAAARRLAPLASGELQAGGGRIAGEVFNTVARGPRLEVVADER